MFFLNIVILFFLRILLGDLEDDGVSENRAVSFSKGVILIFGALIMGFYSGTTLKFGMVTVGWVDAFVVKKGKGSKIGREELKLFEGLIDAKGGKGAKIGGEEIEFSKVGN